jgi:hypothetical protein
LGYSLNLHLHVKVPDMTSLKGVKKSYRVYIEELASYNTGAGERN